MRLTVVYRDNCACGVQNNHDGGWDEAVEVAVGHETVNVCVGYYRRYSLSDSPPAQYRLSRVLCFQCASLQAVWALLPGGDGLCPDLISCSREDAAELFTYDEEG